MTAHTQRAHAKLAPSSAKRWMNCPGSIAASEGIPNISGVFANEGTAAHELCAHCLEGNTDPATYLDMWVDIRAADGAPKIVDLDDEPDDEDRFHRITEEMVEGVGLYVDFVRSLAADREAVMTVEQRLDMTHLHPEISGTGDASVLQVAEKHLHVVDFKYGKGVVVDAEENPQLMLYAAGTLRRSHNHAVEKLTVHVVQPRAPHKDGAIRSFDFDLIELFDFEIDVEAAAKRTEQPDAPRVAGDWCLFCPAGPTCAERRQKAYDDALGEWRDLDLALKEPTEMTSEELAKVVTNADSLLAYVKSVQKYAHDMACRGKSIPGLKLVAKRANRVWKDPDVAIDELTLLGLSKDEMYSEPKLRSPAQLEKYFPGKNKIERQQAMVDLVEKKSSGVNLVPESDPRPAVQPADGSEFAELEA